MKAAIFVALAAGFAWLLGGQLFPGWRAVHLDAVRTTLHEWALVVEGHARRAGEGRWRVERTSLADENAVIRIDLLDSLCSYALGPIVENGNVVVFARASDGGAQQWWRVTISDDGAIARERIDAPYESLMRAAE